MHPLTIIFSFIVLVTLIAFGFGSVMHRRQIAYKERKEALDREAANSAPGATGATVKKLEERVRVLERLATDRGQNLALQIEELRGESPALTDHRAREAQS